MLVAVLVHDREEQLQAQELLRAEHGCAEAPAASDVPFLGVIVVVIVFTVVCVLVSVVYVVAVIITAPVISLTLDSRGTRTTARRLAIVVRRRLGRHLGGVGGHRCA